MNPEAAARDPTQALAEHVEAEQVRLAMEQVRRIPIPHFFVDLCVAWTGTLAGLGAFAWGWLVLMTASQVGRTLYLVHLDRVGGLTANQMLTRLTATLTFLGAMHALFMGVVFAQPQSQAHYILTMIMVGNAAGAVSPAAGHLRSYLAWGVVFGGTLALCWLSRGTLEGAAIAVLVGFLFTVLTLYVRDQGRTLVKLVTLSESLRRERDRAERASEAKTRFFAAASHDLRQPLTALSYNAATVQALARANGDENLAHVGEGIRRALVESRQLLDGLLEMSQLDAGTIAVHCEDVDLSTLLAETVEAFAAQARDRDLTLCALVAKDPVLVAATDRVLLRRIVQNLVGNAIKFTPSGSVTVRAYVDDEDPIRQVRIAVSDTGPGIPAAEQERVFEEFYQVGNVDRNRSRGLGLGLAIVRRLASLIDAEVSLTSLPGQGATFSVALRRSKARPAAAIEPAPAGASSGASPATSRRLLLVDDELDIRESLSTFMVTLGWQVAAGADPGWALARVAGGFEPDAVIVDFRLRDGASGLDVLAALRQAGCMAPAWLITGDTEPRRIAEAQRAGVPVLYKPVDGLELAALLDAQIASRPAQPSRSSWVDTPR